MNDLNPTVDSSHIELSKYRSLDVREAIAKIDRTENRNIVKVLEKTREEWEKNAQQRIITITPKFIKDQKEILNHWKRTVLGKTEFPEAEEAEKLLKDLEAINLTQKSVDGDWSEKNRAQLYFEAGNVKKLEGKLNKAKSWYNEALKEDGNLFEAHIGLADIYKQRGDITHEKENLKHAVYLYDLKNIAQAVRFNHVERERIGKAQNRLAEHYFGEAMNLHSELLVLKPTDPQFEAKRERFDALTKSLLRLYTKAAKNFSPDAHLALGKIYESGILVPKNDFLAVSHFQSASKLDETRILGLDQLLDMYPEGRGLTKYDDWALSWYLTRIEDPGVPQNEKAKYNYFIGLMKEKGYGTSPNVEEALHYFKEALRLGYPANSNIGEIYALQKNMYDAFEYFSDGVENNEAESQYRMALLYEQEIATDVADQAQEAFELFEKAAQQGHPAAQLKMARINSEWYQKLVDMREKMGANGVWEELRPRDREAIAEAHIEFARLKLRDGDEKEAIALYQRAVKDNPYYEPLVELADIYLNQMRHVVEPIEDWESLKNIYVQTKKLYEHAKEPLISTPNQQAEIREKLSELERLAIKFKVARPSRP